MTTKPILSFLDPTSGSVKATRKELNDLGISDSDISSGQARFEFLPHGRIKAIVECGEFGEFSKMAWKQFYSPRTMVDCKPSGYDLEGRVSLGGKKYSCFTSSQLFELEDGSLVDVAVIFARKVPFVEVGE